MSDQEMTGAESQGNQDTETAATVQKIQKQITDIFDVYDHDGNKTADVREIGTIMRSLDLCPTESELNDVLTEIEEEDVTGSIRLERFLPVMTAAIMKKDYRPHPEDKILKAFQTLDTEGKGYLTKDALEQYLTTEGEPFSKDELDEFLPVALDDKEHLVYKEFVPLMIVEENLGN